MQNNKNYIQIIIPKYLSGDITYAGSKLNFQETCLAFVDEKYGNWKQENIDEILKKFNEGIELYIGFLKDSSDRKWLISEKEKELFLKFKRELFYIEKIIDKFAGGKNEAFILKRGFSFTYSNKEKYEIGDNENNELYEFKTDLDLMYLGLMFEKEIQNNGKIKYKINYKILNKIKGKLKNDFYIFLFCYINNLKNERSDIIKAKIDYSENNNFIDFLKYFLKKEEEEGHNISYDDILCYIELLHFIKDKDLLITFIDLLIQNNKFDENILEFLKINNIEKFNEYLEYFKNDKEKYLKYISFTEFKNLLNGINFSFSEIISNLVNNFFENKYIYNEELNVQKFLDFYNEIEKKVSKKGYLLYEFIIRRIFLILSENKEICIGFFKDLILNKNKEIFDFIFNKKDFDIFGKSKHGLKKWSNGKEKIAEIISLDIIIIILNHLNGIKEFEEFDFFELFKSKLENNKGFQLIEKEEEYNKNINIFNSLKTNISLFIKKKKDKNIFIKIDGKSINDENLKIFLLNYNHFTKYKIDYNTEINFFYKELVRKIYKINDVNKDILSNIIFSFIKNDKISINYIFENIISKDVFEEDKLDLTKKICNKLGQTFFIKDELIEKYFDNIIDNITGVDNTGVERLGKNIGKLLNYDFGNNEKINIELERIKKHIITQYEKNNKNIFDGLLYYISIYFDKNNDTFFKNKELLINGFKYFFENKKGWRVKKYYINTLKLFNKNCINELQTYIKEYKDNYKDKNGKIDENIQNILDYFKEEKKENDEKKEVYSFSQIFDFLYGTNKDYEPTKREAYNFIQNQKSGSCLFTGYRGVGKTSMIKSIISNLNEKYEFEYKNQKIIPIVINMPSLKKNGEEYSKEQILNILIRGLYLEIKKVKNISKNILQNAQEQYIRTFKQVDEINGFLKITKRFGFLGILLSALQAGTPFFLSIIIFFIIKLKITITTNIFFIDLIIKYFQDLNSIVNFLIAFIVSILTFFLSRNILNINYSGRLEKTLYSDEIAEYNLNNSLNSINANFNIQKKWEEVKKQFTNFFYLEFKGFKDKKEKENIRYNYTYSLLSIIIITFIFSIIFKNIFLITLLIFIIFIMIKYFHDEKEIFSIKNIYLKTFQIIKNLFIKQNIENKIVIEKINEVKKDKKNYLEILKLQLLYIKNLTKLGIGFGIFFIVFLGFGIFFFNLNFLQSNILGSSNYSNIAIFFNWIYLVYIALLSLSLYLYDKFYKLLAIPGYLIDYFINYKNEYKIVFIIDELDKVLSLEKNHFKQKEMMEKIFDVLGKLKILFFDTSNSLFFVVANKTAYDYYIQNKSQEEDLISNIFNKTLYLPMRERYKFRFNHEVKIGEENSTDGFEIDGIINQGNLEKNKNELKNINNIMDYYYYTSHANFRKLTFNINQELQVENNKFYLNFDSNQIHTTKYYDFFNMIYEIFKNKKFDDYGYIKLNKNFIDDFINNLKEKTKNFKDNPIYKNILDFITDLKLELADDNKKIRDLDSKILFLESEFQEISKKDNLKLNAYIFESIEKIVGFYINEDKNENENKNNKQHINIVYRDIIMNLLLNTMENIRTYRKLEIKRLFDKLNLGYDDIMYPAFDDFVIIWLPLMSYYYETRKLTILGEDLIFNN